MRFAAAALALLPAAALAQAPLQALAETEEHFAVCRELGGSPSLLGGYVTVEDLNGDERPDYIYDLAQLECRDAWSAFCGAAGCPVTAWLSTRGGGHEPFRFGHLHGFTIERGAGLPRVVATYHGSGCGAERLGVEGCTRAWVFDTNAPDLPPAAEVEVAQAAEPLADAVEPEADAVEPAAEAVEPEADAVDPAAETVEPAADAVEPAAETVEPMAEAAEPAVEPAVEAAEQDGAAMAEPGAASGPGPLPRPGEAPPPAEGWTLREVEGSGPVAVGGGPGGVASLAVFCLAGQPWLAVTFAEAPEAEAVALGFAFPAAGATAEEAARREEGAGGAYVVALEDRPLAGLLAGRDSTATLSVEGAEAGVLSLAGSTRSIRAALEDCHQF